MYYKGKWCTAGGKDPLFGHVDGFQIDPNYNYMSDRLISEQRGEQRGDLRNQNN
mgnify:FL=1